VNDVATSVLVVVLLLGGLAGLAYAIDRKNREYQDASANDHSKSGTRKFFYISVVLLISGLLLIGLGSLYNSLLFMGIGISTILGAGILRLYWWMRVLF